MSKDDEKREINVNDIYRRLGSDTETFKDCMNIIFAKKNKNNNNTHNITAHNVSTGSNEHDITE